MRPGQHKRLPNHVVGLIALIVLAVAFALAFTKKLPWSDGYEIQAVFTTAQNINKDSPVRIAGVEVGKVTSVEPLQAGDEAFDEATEGEDEPSEGTTAGDEPAGQQAALVTMEIEDSGRPIKTDATMQLRPRLFLEGNLFVDLRPGTPGAEEAPDGYTLPVDQTSVSVQLDQILTTLQSDVRTDLQVFLEEFGAALTDHGGGEGFQELYRTSPRAFKYTSQVNEALLGTEPHDLSGFIRNFDRVARGLVQNEQQLRDLVTNFRVVAGSFAAEADSLEQAIVELPLLIEASEPAFANLNASFPALRAFAREALPGVRSSARTIDVALPFVHQLRLLVSKNELRGLVAELRPTIPRLAKLAKRTIPFLKQSRALSSCFNNVIIPWGFDTVDGGTGYPHEAVGPVYKETGYGLVGIAGESRSGDANGQYIKVAAGGGTNTVAFDPPGAGEDFFGVTPFAIDGAMPAIDSSEKTKFRPDVPCETQEPPNLDAGAPGLGPTQSRVAFDSPQDIGGPVSKMLSEQEEIFSDGLEAAEEGNDEDVEALEEDYADWVEDEFPVFQEQIEEMGE
jgi:phospholipid/cholesterol/gamma-HCH transport system substrate-binding protein